MTTTHDLYNYLFVQFGLCEIIYMKIFCDENLLDEKKGITVASRAFTQH